MTPQPRPSRAAQPGQARPAGAGGHLIATTDEAHAPHAAAEHGDPGEAAAAMLSYVMGGAAAQRRLHTEGTRGAVLPHFTYPAGDTGARPHHLAAAGSLAKRWGDSAWRMLRAIVAAPAGPATADHDRNTHQASIHPRDRRGHGILRGQARKSTRPCR
jgi:hypothetical protein